jgi:large subunit ribosomal protein L23
MWNIIKKPLVTEKNTVHSERGVYVFEVDDTANKTEIKDAVQKVFGVKVQSVRTINARDRKRRVGNRTSKTVNKYKKALVQLAKGEKIALFEGA